MSQGRRLGPVIDRRLRDILQNGVDARAYQDPDAIAPERALVLEIYGSVQRFANAAERVGLEWLAEEIVRLAPPDDLQANDHLIEEDLDEYLFEGEFQLDGVEPMPSIPQSGVTGRLYLAMPTIESLERLLELWDKFRRGDPAPDKHGDWWELFKQLRDVRGWSVQDRLPPDAISAIATSMQRHPNEAIPIELDLWFRDNPRDRQRAWTTVRRLIEAEGGMVLDEAHLPDIRYHAALVRMEPDALSLVLAGQSDIALAREIMAIRPQSMAAHPPTDDGGAVGSGGPAFPVPSVIRPAIAALLDGEPVSGHALLNGRLDVWPLDDVLPTVGEQRYHGTAMASLILNGDLDAGGPALDRRLHVVPLLTYVQSEGREVTPLDKLPLRLVYEAVVRMKQGLPGGEPTGRSVVIINHSLGDLNERLLSSPSPWARALDYLSYHYRVLFVISTGNFEANFSLDGYSSLQDFYRADPMDRERRIIAAVDASRAARRLLAPAEAVNALTIGALHRDHAGPVPGNVVDPFPTFHMANLASRVGLGLRNSIKPELIVDGGRVLAQPTAAAPLLIRAHGPQQVGQKVAAPHHTGILTHTARCCGTSNAAALTTRAGILLSDLLDDATELTGAPAVSDATRAVVLKALLAHTAAWGNAGEHMEDWFEPRGPHAWLRRRENISRYLGFGIPDLETLLGDSQHRVTLVGDGELRQERAHEYRIPLPPSLSSRVDLRRLIVTLAWFSPVRAGSQAYRAFGMEVVPHNRDKSFGIGVAPVRCQPPLALAERGTLVHRILEGEAAVPFLEDGAVVLRVQCKKSPFARMAKLAAPYGLAVTLEVANTINTDIYTEVADRVRVQQRQ
ncbi:subtilase family protein [Azospirillum brasilense]|uniref:Subtilase family protein n=2 Tax=Azospirillum brasilense TaxID=192 RepID=A0A560B1J2_AZOBR|nr:subtilase family protein [Azospirillum brasilense]